MENNNAKKILLKMLPILIILLFSTFQYSAQASEKLKTIRVGFFKFDGYHAMNPQNGEKYGYGYELLQHMLGYSNWKYEYVGYSKSWSAMQDMLEHGEIDILTSAQKTPERLKRFDFSDKSIGTSAAILTVKSGNSNYISNDYSTWNGMRVGMIRKNSRNNDFAYFAEKNDFTYLPVYYDDIDNAVRDLKNEQKIDALLSSNLRIISDEWVLAKFDASPFYIMVKKGNTQLLKEINFILEQLENDEINLYEKLMNKYYTVKLSEKIPYTFMERSYIKSMNSKKLTAIINPDRAPLSSFEDGKPVGIIADIAAKLISDSNLDIQIIEPASLAEYNEYLESGNVDVCFDFRYDYNKAEISGYRLTQAYFESPVSCLFRKDNPKKNSVALITESDFTQKYAEKFQGRHSKIVYYDNIAEVVEAIISKKQDLAYLYSNTCEMEIYNDITNSLVFKNVPNIRIEFAVAINESQDKRLYSIINKAVANLNEDGITEIVNKNMDFKQPIFSIVGYIYDNPWFLVVLFIVVSLFIIFLINIFWMLHNKKLDRLRLIDEQRINEILADALEDAEAADKAKTAFLSNMSHEMRTPLNAIIGFMYLAKEANEKQMKTYLSNSEIAAKQLLSVINDVLDMSAIGSGKIKLSQEVFDLKKLIHSLTDIYFVQCRDKEIKYKTEITNQIDEWLVGDPLRLNQILINLLGNAVKFTENGNITLRITQVSTEKERLFLRFEVIDTGCGISEEMQQRLFLPFEQETVDTSKKYGGTGLGLSIVKSLVDMMHGAIKVESVLGKGTRFMVDLPFANSEKNDNNLEFTDKSVVSRIMIVNDDPIECEYLSMLFKGIGVRCNCISEGKQALVELDAASQIDDKYNICLIDWDLSDMDRLELVSRIRKTYGDTDLIIAMVAYNYYQSEEKIQDIGINVLLPKPLFKSSILALLMTFTDGQITKSSESAQETPDFEGRRILLAEDNEMNRMVIIGILKKFGIKYEAANDGKIATDKFLSRPKGYFDAVLMDIHMPNMDGYEATSIIRNSQHADAKTIPIIALTADAFNEDVAKMYLADMNAHIAKPVDIKLLQEILAKSFKKK